MIRRGGRLARWLPGWLGEYRQADLSPDLLAGLVVAVMLVPQAMAYSLLAGLPPQVGLYSAVAATLVYPWLGSSRYLAVGPVAIVSLLVATGIASLGPASEGQYLAYAAMLALLVGLLQGLMGWARLGVLANLLSHSVIAGFTTAAALAIALSQVAAVLGVAVPRGGSAVEALVGLLARLGETNLASLALGGGAVALLVLFTRGLHPLAVGREPGGGWLLPLTRSAPLLVVLAGVALVVWLDLDTAAGVQVVGEIPRGLPSFQAPRFDLAVWRTLLPTALAITFVGFAESYAVAKSLASKKRERVDPNRELKALGAANLAASLVGGYPVTGGFSRSVVNFEAGARSGLASLVTGAVLIPSLWLLTPGLARLPRAALAAVVIVAVATLVDFRSLRRIWRYSRAEGAAFLVTFGAVLLVSVEAGLLVGVGVALALHLWRTTRPHVAVVGRVPGTEHYRNVLRHPVWTHPEVLAVRIDESLYFANAAYLEGSLLKLVAEQPRARHLVLILSAANFVDGGALETLERLIEELREAGVTLHLAEVKGPVEDRLRRSRLLDHLRPGRSYLATHEAFEDLCPSPPEAISAGAGTGGQEPRQPSQAAG